MLSFFQYPEEDAKILDEEFATLFVNPSGRRPSSSHIQVPMRSQDETHLRSNIPAQSVHFEETMYDIEEEETLKEHISQHFVSDNYSTHYMHSITNFREPSTARTFISQT